VAAFAQKRPSEIEDVLDNFVEGGAAAVNNAQRIILIAEDFDYSVLVTSEWLSERYGLDIRCYRLRLAGEDTAEFLTCERVYPPAELTDVAVRVRVTPGRPPRYKNWEEALSGVENDDLVEFFKQEIDNGRTGYATRRILNFDRDGSRWFWLRARRNYAYVWQLGRFDGDDEFWRSKLGGPPEDVAVVGNRRNRVRFRLRTAAQIAAFREAINGDLVHRPFVNTPLPGDHAEAEPEDEDDGP
jgi:hypothetical protein